MYVNDQGGLYICRYRPPVHNPLRKKKGIPECNLFVTQRIYQLSATHRSAHQDVQGLDGGISVLHSSKSSASSRFHFQSTLLKKEMDNELTSSSSSSFSSDLEEHSHHKKLKKKSDLLSSNGSVWRYSARVGVAANFCVFSSTG
jgi:hypothetical protein